MNRKKYIKNNCLYCGKPVRRNAKYCSADCRSNACRKKEVVKPLEQSPADIILSLKNDILIIKEWLNDILVVEYCDDKKSNFSLSDIRERLEGIK